ncbi:MAG: transketolase [Candidatus Sumerlaeia bacterium]|nr:transketolase [Candidatus Sumerlaeia bacterium]
MSTSQEQLDLLCINTIRTLSMDMVQQAKSGHPGTAMALAPLAYVLWNRFMKYNPRNPHWPDRDRFVLSAGHASVLQYAVLFLTGYDLTLDDLKKFRQWGSKTPGHPEYEVVPGVETTTGPLGQGCMNAVGMAMAEAHLAAVYNRPGFEIVNHHTYVICGDGDLMEGASHEAASLAGHLGLGKLIFIYDDNHISIEGSTDLTYSDDVAKRFESYHWHVQNIGDNANDLGRLSAALDAARRETERPSLIIVRSHIAYGSPNRQDTKEAHGEPLGEEECRLTKRAYGWPEDAKFLVPDDVLAYMREAVGRGRKLEEEWNEKFAAYRKAFPELAAQFEAAIKGELPADWDAKIPRFEGAEKPAATRATGGKVLNAIAEKVPFLAGGSADLAPSTRTLITSCGYFAKGQYANRNFAFGVREHVMCGACNGMALHGGIRPYAATFFVFTDYARPSMRLSALMNLPVIYYMTHDSIGLGEDGPTHQPVEHLAALRAMPNMCVIRPADANETAYAWRAAMLRKTGPTVLVLTRQNVPVLDPAKYASAEGVLKGAYILSKEKAAKPDLILIASGSEVHLALEAQAKLEAEGVAVRVVSLPSWELFRAQPQGYRDEVLPPAVRARLAIEAASPMGWHEWVGDGGDVIGIEKFGASAPYQELFKQYGLTVENVIARAKKLLA